MKLRYSPFTLQLRDTFTLSGSSRTTTAVMLVEVEHDGIVGYGEASMPPYLGESHETASTFLSRVDLARYTDYFQLEQILTDIDAVEIGNNAAKAAIDIALHDWGGKKIGMPWYRILGLDPAKSPPTSFTIGIDTEDIVRRKARKAAGFPFLKIKLGGENDRGMINAVRSVTDVPLRVDCNQGWSSRDEALVMIEWLAGKGVELVEQPMAKDRIDDHAWLKERSPIPIVADESVSRLNDLLRVHGAFDGVNIKLMKCTGMREAYRMMLFAKALGMKVMLGCMTETSCAISAAAQLSPLADWTDLDGALLIQNDPFAGATVEDGKIVIPDSPGIGVRKL